MKESCNWIALVKNKQDELVESKLFKGLLTNLEDRELTVKTYGWLRSPQIQSDLSFIARDENNEFKLEELSKIYDFSTLIGNEKFIKNIEKLYKTKKKDGTYFMYLSELEPFKKALNFNTTNPFRNIYEMKVVKILSPGGGIAYSNQVVRKLNVLPQSKKSYKLEQEQVKYNKNLNDKLRLLATKYGISIGALNELDKRLKVSGVMDTGTASTITDGLLEVIRLAEGVKGEAALPEEFAHFIVEAMGNHPLITRLMAQLKNNEELLRSVLGESYNRYSELYENNPDAIAKEAMGKLLAKHLLQNEEIPSGPIKSLLDRLLSSIKNFFSKLGVNGFKDELYRAKVDLDTQFSNFAKDLMHGSLDSYINKKNLLPLQTYYLAEQEVVDISKTLATIIDKEEKRYINFSGRKANKDREQLIFINQLKSFERKKEYINGISTMLERATSQLVSLKKRSIELIKELGEIDENSINPDIKKAQALKIKEIAGTLRDIKEYTQAYLSITEKINSDLVKEEYMTVESQYTEVIKNQLIKVNGLAANLLSAYSQALTPLFIKFMQPFIGDALTVISKHKGKEVTLKAIAESGEGDIGIVDYWVNSMANANDVMLNMVDLVVKDQSFAAELDALNTQKRLSSYLYDYEEATGSSDVSWMYEVNADGKTTGTYVSEIDHAAFKTARENYLKSLPKMSLEELQLTSNNWFRENTVSVKGILKPDPKKFGNKLYIEIQNNPAKLKLYNSILAEKDKLDKLLPEHKRIPLHLAIQVRKDTMERIMSKGGISVNTVVEGFKDLFTVRDDDYEYGNVDTNGNIIMELPIYFTKPISNPEDISTDLIATMSAYATMVHKFDHMNDVIDALELTREIIAKRKNPNQNLKGNALSRKIKQFGITKEEKSEEQNSENSNTLKRFDDYMTMMVYGELKAREKYGKIIDTIVRLTAMNNLGFNYINNIANVTNGTAMMEIERFSGQFFGKKDVVKADLIWGEELLNYMGDLGRRNKSSKMALFIERFNVMQDASNRLKHTAFKKSLWAAKSSNLEAFAFAGGDAGEIWMNTRTALALAVKEKLKDANGNEISLWEALEVKPYNEKVLDDKGKETLQTYKANTLVIKEGVTKLDGTPFSMQDIIKFLKLSSTINQRMFGIYNEVDRAVAQLYAMGRAAMLFRKYMVPAVNRRYAVGKYNFDSQTWDEGYYRTAGRFLKTLYTDFKNIENLNALRWSEMDEDTKRNIYRALTEMTIFLSSITLLALMGAGDDDHDKGWLTTMFELQLSRFNLEIGAMVPEPITMFKSANKLLQDPFASSNYVAKIGKIFDFMHYNDILESGRYKGHSKAFKYYMDLLPAHSVIYKFTNPEEALKFYQNQ